ncbi:MAG TPA: VOC family protein [Thermoleophilaceae bacterium]|nr:VOC family protein [Thermoleophilaceae bacterium]
MAEEPKLGWVIVYVPDVRAALEFYERAFGLRRSFLAESGEFGQLDTGTTALAFASEELGDSNFPGGFERPRAERPGNVELCLVFDDVEAGFSKAVDAGCKPLAAPTAKPQGQTVGYVRDPFGTLVEIASPLG